MILEWMLFFVSLHAVTNKFLSNTFYNYDQIHQTRNGGPQWKG